MKEYRFVQIHKEDAAQYAELLPHWLAFLQELDDHQHTCTPHEDRVLALTRRIHIQGKRQDMHFEMCYQGDTLVGFANFAIDTGTIYGLIDAGYGAFLGFYVLPEYRRQGVGRRMFQHMQATLVQDGATHLYVCPDTVTGEPFWAAMGFVDSGKMDPDDQLPIWIKQISSR